MGTYIDFMELMPRNMALAQEFIKNLKRFSADELSAWFRSKGFTVTGAECGSILANARSKHRDAPVMWAY
ncbi:MAG TPA: hypothetical protein PLM53_03595 [Spirochaetota bacterium]|nr:hypothetical protein [Spirochaetota bacterium]HPC40266.1 hypothetical protein [Spirochaetota bacterium]HPL15309.1 hypothetical protein [Spirochaetota bacterium]HQF07259.1 hypothetical protein [Spirochaetota bacterium]HQH96160.1 hypothetical protein [Spirochaetota bacterium]